MEGKNYFERVMGSSYKLNETETRYTWKKCIYISLIQNTVTTSERKIEAIHYVYHPVYLSNMIILHLSNMIIIKESLSC